MLFQWDAEAAQTRAKELEAAGWEVRIESEDGGRGCRTALNDMPDLFVFDLGKRPSHSRETASAIRGFRAGRRAPMLFVGGSPEEKEKVAERVMDAMFLVPEMLVERLGRFDF